MEASKILRNAIILRWHLNQKLVVALSISGVDSNVLMKHIELD